MGSVSQHTADERKERKKLQNRINQRARRQRLRDKSGIQNQRAPYQITRWRLDESAPPEPASQALVPSSRRRATDQSIADDGDDQPLASQATDSYQAPGRNSTASSAGCLRISLPTDHVLLHLISHNVSRGIFTNKNTLKLVGTFISAMSDIAPHHATSMCNISVFRHTDQPMPRGLQPTQLQMNRPHPTWIDALPFPKIRDNLIRQQDRFHHGQFVADLIGDSTYVPPPTTQGKPPVEQADPIGNGLILWGEPHFQESWEVTPVFLSTWMWVIGGSDELVKSSNTWRAARGEDPLDVPLVGND